MSDSHADTELHLFRPHRSWFLVPAGTLAVWLLDKIGLPVWLAIITMVLLVLSAVAWPWIEQSGKRRRLFWILTGCYAVFGLVVLLAVNAPKPVDQSEHKQESFLVSSPSPSAQLTATPSSASPSPSPTGSLATPSSKRRRIRTTLPKSQPCSAEDRLRGLC